jgi:hypothetical protein
LIRILPLIIHILQEPATPNQINEMLQANRFYIKTAVDIRHQILAGGGEMHMANATLRYQTAKLFYLKMEVNSRMFGARVGILFLKKFSMNQW